MPELMSAMFDTSRRGRCKVCGCTDDHACDGGCYWLNLAQDLCSACENALVHVVELGFNPRFTHRTARCIGCAWRFELKRTRNGGGDKSKLRGKVREHWRAMVAEAA